ncbi:hypothetical protein BC832DRAFT_568499 [Gaertneriomyces semiglobifer]|nr:hypothetical protein BC832DRAFT_568499 [Gaertneriomyces semiglobifer]
MSVSSLPRLPDSPAVAPPDGFNWDTTLTLADLLAWFYHPPKLVKRKASTGTSTTVPAQPRSDLRKEVYRKWGPSFETECQKVRQWLARTTTTFQTLRSQGVGALPRSSRLGAIISAAVVETAYGTKCPPGENVQISDEMGLHAFADTHVHDVVQMLHAALTFSAAAAVGADSSSSSPSSSGMSSPTMDFATGTTLPLEGPHGEFVTYSGLAHVVGNPDRVWTPLGFEKPILAIEDKTHWALDVGSAEETDRALAAFFQNRDSGEKMDSKFLKFGKAVEQIYGYMTFNFLRFGILSTYQQTWVFERVLEPGGQGGVLQMAGPFSPGPELVEVYLTMVLLAQDAWLYVSPTSSVIPKTLPEKLLRMQRHIVNPDTVDLGDSCTQVTFTEGIVRSQTGAVVAGSILDDHGDEKPVIFKTADMLVLQGSLASKLNHEVQVYDALKELQGSCIPRCYGYGVVGGMLGVLVFERLGPSLAEVFRSDVARRDSATLIDAAIACLVRVHRAGYLHMDIRPYNFCIIGDVGTTTAVRIIDFGEAVKIDPSQAEARQQMDAEVSQCRHMLDDWGEEMAMET